MREMVARTGGPRLAVAWSEMENARWLGFGRRWRAREWWTVAGSCVVVDGGGLSLGRKWVDGEGGKILGGSSVWDENEKMGIDGWVLKFEFFFYI